MPNLKIYCFMSDPAYARAIGNLNINKKDLEFIPCASLKILETKFKSEANNIILSFGLGEIIPKSILDGTKLAINIHGASPSYPGRDPHHWAAYDAVKEYGAVAHIMEAKVDSGSIIDIELVPVEQSSPQNLLNIANESGFKILDRLIAKICNDDTNFTPLPISWDGVKRKRSDLMEQSRIDPYISLIELDKKFMAFQDGIDHKNLYVDLYNYRFRFEKILDQVKCDDDLSLKKYGEYLSKIKSHYSFIQYDQAFEATEPNVIWRHDIDASVHQAYELAKIENRLGIKATYFVMLHSWFYDIREKEVNTLLKNIKDLGHTIGLHFDFEYIPSGAIDDEASFLKALKHQKEELELILGFGINFFSFHNPTTISDELRSKLTEYKYEDMINVYHEKFINEYKYCSDSNGLWRFDKLSDLIDPKKYPKLHVLTHPEWWTENPMTPRQKIVRILNGRTKAILKQYDTVLANSGRPNF